MTDSYSKHRSPKYLILFCVTIVLTLEAGIVKSFGVLLPSLREQFDTYTWVIGLAISFIPGIGSFVCLFLPVLRRSSNIDAGYVISFVGAITGIGLLLGSLSQHLTGLVITITIQSFLAFAKVTALGVLPDYFEDKTIDMANSISGCGISLGIIALPPFTQLLLETYGWRGVMSILGAVTLHCIVCGYVIRYYEKARFKLTITNEYTTLIDSNNESSQVPLKRIATFVTNSFNLELLTKWTFINVLVFSVVVGWSFGSWLIYLIPNAEEKGIIPIKASLLGTIGGFSNIVGKLTFPALKEVVSARLVMYISCTISGISLVIDPFVHSFTGMAISTTVYMFTIGLGFIATFSVMYDAHAQETSDDVTDAFAWFYVVYGPGAIAGGFTSGWLFDQTGSYNISFMLMGGVMFLPPVSLGIEDLYRIMTKPI